MLECQECGFIFEDPKKYVETHGFDFPPYEEFYGCPNCSGSYEEIKEDEDGEEEDEC